MKKYGQSSIWDNLMKIMPELKDSISKSPTYVDPTIAKSLYNIWRTGSKTGDVYKKPVTLSHDEFLRMKDAGLITAIGENINITDKGSKIIKVMILGDDRSVYEDDGNVIDYNIALNNSKGVKTAKTRKIANSWWDRFEKNAYEEESKAKYQCKCGEEFDEPKVKTIGDEYYNTCPACGDDRIIEN